MMSFIRLHYTHSFCSLTLVLSLHHMSKSLLRQYTDALFSWISYKPNEQQMLKSSSYLVLLLRDVTFMIFLVVTSKNKSSVAANDLVQPLLQLLCLSSGSGQRTFGVLNAHQGHTTDAHSKVFPAFFGRHTS
jgi:hypothetical protein